MKKILLWLAAGLAVFFVVIYVSLGWIVKSAVLKVGPMITKTTVSVGSVRLGPLTGWGKIRGFKIGNPLGFSRPDAVAVDSFKISLHPRSVFSDRIRIREIVIDGPEIDYESGPHGNNLEILQANVAKFSPPEEGGKSKPQKKVEIDHLIIRSGKIHWKIDLALPDVELKDLGKDTGGMKISDAVGRVLKEMTQGAGKAVAGGVQNAARGVKDSLKGILGR